MDSEIKQTKKSTTDSGEFSKNNLNASVERTANKMIVGAIDINVLLAFVFGVIFLGIMLEFATEYPNPSPFQIQVFMTALSISGAGIGALLPGRLDVRYKNLLRASGAFSLFVIIWFFKPAILESVVKLEMPTLPPEEVINQFFSHLDSGDTFKSYSDLDPIYLEITGISGKDWSDLYNINIRQLGKMEKRQVAGVNSINSTNITPVGLYREFTYLTKYANAKDCRTEAITVRATQDKQWRITSYLISPTSVECPLSFST